MADELERGAPWMYPWRLRDGSVTPLAGPELPDIHRTRAELIEADVRAALAAAGPSATVIDLACNEGWFSQRALEWGAGRVLGIDIRPELAKRAELIRDHYEIPSSRLEFRSADVFDLDLATLGTFDVVLCLGLVYHLEDPVGALRIANTLTGRLCAIESQLTRQTDPILLGNGRSGQYEESAASYAAIVETDYETNLLASAGGVVSLVPNRAALGQAAQAAGFGRIEFADPQTGHNHQYVVGDRAVLLAWQREHGDRSAEPASSGPPDQRRDPAASHPAVLNPPG
ncbi:MAG TPA: methyltransferase domain-containing protein [Solirubrobacteraceae bacterium]